MGTIVVGVDGSSESRRALAWALEEARLRGARVEVVYAWTLPVTAFAGFAAPVDSETIAAVGNAAKELVDMLVTELAGADEAVDVCAVALEGGPASVLLEAAQDADLLVVGSRGHGGFSGLLLGSVSQQCSHHARCPVVIVPPPRDR